MFVQYCIQCHLWISHLVSNCNSIGDTVSSQISVVTTGSPPLAQSTVGGKFTTSVCMELALQRPSSNRGSGIKTIAASRL